ncbi:NAD(P)-binding protein [Sneathiella chungangensis]|uniref:NAD(P)-binding protein n=1 Tax=Sneathiella chungangensis TaxID=1418234 RepID=A0A845M880_9PROT|nr:NAD(P)-dependent oxidoreductase [Sneathiella chungangensis]MZR20789.1 NAD(P)-binding protein [Sneathiella chungangensis]
MSDIAAGRLSGEELAENFADIHPPLDARTAHIEASRCYFCYDAPCMEACPTGIDIPSFIRKIATGNVRGSAIDILEENIMGGACARVCPTEVLCEGACVRTAQEGKPVTIGALQRFATDDMMARGEQPFERADATGRKVAIIGAGPAGLAAAHRLAQLGHECEVFEALPKSGGLNEYGIADYKVVDDFAQKEVRFILGIGGITVQNGKALGRDIQLGDLRNRYDAVFIGGGLGAVQALGLEGERIEGVFNAVDYIADLRQTKDKGTLAIGRRVVVIGGGSTAIDIAVKSKRLGAEDVTIVYRRGAEAMSATAKEQEFAQVNGVKIKHWMRPAAILSDGGAVSGIEFEYTKQGADGKLTGTGEKARLAADMVFKAIGQVFVPDPVSGTAAQLELKNGRIAVDDSYATSLEGVYAGGDCIDGNIGLTVAAVQDGKLAAHAINDYLAKK